MCRVSDKLLYSDWLKRLICTIPHPPEQPVFLCTAVYAEKRPEIFMTLLLISLLWTREEILQ
jgi:hypothetical protein